MGITCILDLFIVNEINTMNRPNYSQGQLSTSLFPYKQHI